jgi:RND family efflux transporter MFP subunit
MSNLTRILALLFALCVLPACSAADPPAPGTPAAAASSAAARPVAVALPMPGAEPTRIRATGRLESADELRLSFKVAGVLASLAVDAGDRVAAGQVLAQLDPTETAAAVARAEQSLEKAQRDLTRAEEVFGRGLVSREQRDNAATARDIAAADLRSVRFNQQFARIVAPAAGRVKQRLAEAGEVIAAGQPVLTVSSESRGWLLRAAFADRDALRLAPGDAAEVRFDAMPGRRFEGRITRIAGQADAATGMIEVELALDAGDAPLRSGLLGKLAVAASADSAVLSIPVSALLQADGAEAQVLVVVDGRARLRRIALGAIGSGRVDVRDGLAADEQVIVAGAAFVDDGEAVRIVKD